MIVDSSAIVAILRLEPEAAQFTRLISDTTDVRISAANALESCIVIDQQGDPVASNKFDDYMKRGDFQVVPVTEDHVWVARQAYREFGKGNHPAALNFGDCFAYALAKTSDEPLLFKGDDFSQTDIKPAV